MNPFSLSVALAAQWCRHCGQKFWPQSNYSGCPSRLSGHHEAIEPPPLVRGPRGYEVPKNYEAMRAAKVPR